MRKTTAHTDEVPLAERLERHPACRCGGGELADEELLPGECEHWHVSAEDCGCELGTPVQQARRGAVCTGCGERVDR